MAKRKRFSQRQDALQCRYSILIYDWHIKVIFNDYMYQKVFNSDEFEERINLELEGRVTSTTSKKCKDNMAARIIVESRDFSHAKNTHNEGLHAIGYVEIEKADSEFYMEDTLYVWFIVPKDSYENMKDYLAYKGNAMISLTGTELHYRKGKVYSLEFGKECDSMK